MNALLSFPSQISRASDVYVSHAFLAHKLIPIGVLDPLVSLVSPFQPRLGTRLPGEEQDFYDWHSWTSGLFPQADGKSQESVSESINAYYAVYLLGHAVDDGSLKDWGRVLLAMELRAARKYWQMPGENGVGILRQVSVRKHVGVHGSKS